MKHPLQHRWIMSIALLTILVLSGCGNKAEESTKTSSPSGESGGSTSTTAPSGGATTSTEGTLSAEAKKLGVKPEGETTCPSSAPVKGLVTKKRGNIYRAPNTPDYAKVKPEICFADVATAGKAGFSAPK
ncbi:MAG: hypothetical protein KME49_24160 [Brasilonema octagenarum HA4186-MV1]|nr:MULTISPECIES: hypothetical protein [Brasilonema]MBW4628524.1 hypothetical protein [Brasilonema octagenarum HA4186-MV1]